MSVPLGRLLAEISSLAPLTSPATVDRPIAGIRHDSRRVGVGDLFVATRGLVADGHQFLDEAVHRGAAALVGERSMGEVAALTAASGSAPLERSPYIQVTDSRKALGLLSSAFHDHPSSSFPLVGVTGTNGKTSVTWMCHAALSGCGLSSALLGTLGSGDPLPSGGRRGSRLGWNDAAHTTPEAPDLQERLASWRDAGVQVGVMEVSSHALSLRRTYGTRFACAVFTNLSPEHLDFHGTLDSYRRAKGLLFRRRERGPQEPPTIAVVNGDDPATAEILGGSDDRILRFGRGETCDIRSLSTEIGADGIRLKVAIRTVAGFGHGAGEVEVRSRLLGGFQVDNLLAALGTGLALGLDMTDFARGLGTLGGVPGRMERVDGGGHRPVLVDYAHTPDALERSLEALRPFVSGRLILVFGCGGERDRAKRSQMGAIAAGRADRIFLTDDNPRREDPSGIRREVRTGIEKAGGSCTEVADRAEAIALALRDSRAGDAVLIAGKGAETVQLRADGPHPFDDRVIARLHLGEGAR